jgi:hypothetical protein
MIAEGTCLHERFASAQQNRKERVRENAPMQQAIPPRLVTRLRTALRHRQFHTKANALRP